jgi:serine/threonine-protein kinase
MRRYRAARAGATFSIALVASAGGASAQPAPSRAEELFREARKLMDQKDYATACPMLVESEALEPAPGTLLNLGDCYEKNGQTASAWVAFQDAARLATTRNKQNWVTLALQRTAALEPKLSKLTISVTKDVAGLQVSRDGQPIEKAIWGMEVVVDPGPHVLAATAPGRRAWTSRVDVPTAKRVTAEIPALDADPASAPKAEPLAPAPKEEPRDDGAGTLRIVGLAAAGVGIVGLGIGAFAGVRALSLRSDAASSANDDAKTFATISTIGLVAGGALAAGGIALVVLAPRFGSVGVRVAPTGRGGAIEGRF